MELKTTLDEKMTEKFRVVKEHTGMKSDKSVLGLLISQEYSRIQRRKYRRVFIQNEAYDLFEKEAEAQGQSVDEYVQELTEEHFRKVKEGVKDGSSN